MQHCSAWQQPDMQQDSAFVEDFFHPRLNDEFVKCTVEHKTCIYNLHGVLSINTTETEQKSVANPFLPLPCDQLKCFSFQFTRKLMHSLDYSYQFKVVVQTLLPY